MKNKGKSCCGTVRAEKHCRACTAWSNLNEASRKFVLVGVAWDFGWKIAAVRRAIKRGQPKWILPLLLVNSLGLLPMGYLLTHPERDE